MYQQGIHVRLPHYKVIPSVSMDTEYQLERRDREQITGLIGKIILFLGDLSIILAFSLLGLY